MEEYIKSFTHVPYAYYEENMPTGQYEIIILDFNKYGFEHFNLALRALKQTHSAILCMIGGTPLIYTLIRDGHPVLIRQNDLHWSFYITYGEKRDEFNVSYIPKMQPQWYWHYLHSWNAQGNRNIICPERFLIHILYNRFNKPVHLL